MLPQFDRLAGRLNWEPLRATPCERCRSIMWPPTAGSYGSALGHFESILGPLPEPKSRLRLLILLQDPRGQDKFLIASPTKNPVELADNEHRYFCLTKLAWKSLGLDIATGSAQPVWPTEKTAPMFLRRYFRRGRRSWSYDGFLAYFLYLFRPEAAYITNLAKCNFGKTITADIVQICSSTHLVEERLLLQPNLVMSFASMSRESVLSMRLYHPAAHKSHTDKMHRLQSELMRPPIYSRMRELGIDPGEIATRWQEHVMAM